MFDKNLSCGNDMLAAICSVHCMLHLSLIFQLQFYLKSFTFSLFKTWICLYYLKTTSIFCLYLWCTFRKTRQVIYLRHSTIIQKITNNEWVGLLQFPRTYCFKVRIDISIPIWYPNASEITRSHSWQFNN